MNKETAQFWERYKKETELYNNVKVAAWQFGVDPDTLAKLVVKGIKTATCSWHRAYEIENEVLPEAGQYDIVLNSKDEPVAIIRNMKVEVVRMNKVDETFAISEGEGDRTYQYWWDTHVEFFNEQAKHYNETFSTDDYLVCETFEVVKVNE